MKDRSKDLFTNIREIVRAWRNSSDAVFALHWKRIWPFRLFWPQVDYPRLGRILTTTRNTCADQLVFLERELASSGGSAELRNFYRSARSYVESISVACADLTKLTEYRQEVLEKKRAHGIREWDALVVAYKQSSEVAAKAGNLCGISYSALLVEDPNTKTGQP